MSATAGTSSGAVKDVTGWVAVLTGAGSGIGRACALSFARRGMDVVVTDVDGDRAEAVAGEVRAEGRRALGLRCDVASLEDLEAVRAQALAELGRIDLVMNNVGVLVVGLPEDLPLSAWERMIDLNLMGLVRSNQVFLPGLLAQGSGHVVNTASTAGLYAYSYDRLPYSATKHAVVGISEALSLYLRPRGVGLSLLCPGPVATNIGEQIRFFGPPRALRPPALSAHMPEEVGELVADAVVEDRFLVHTSPEVAELLRRRAADPDAFLYGQIRTIAADEGIDLPERP